MNVHSGFIHNSFKVETTQIFIDRKVGNQIVVYLFNKILLRNGRNKLLIYAIRIKDKAQRTLC